MGCFSGRLMSTASDRKLFCKLCSPFCCSFNEFVEEKVITPSYSSAILTPPQIFFYICLSSRSWAARMLEEIRKWSVNVCQIRLIWNIIGYDPIMLHYLHSYFSLSFTFECVCVCVCVCVCTYAQLLSRVWLSATDPKDYSPPDSSVRGILQTRILEWVAISSPEDLPNAGIEPAFLAFSV